MENASRFDLWLTWTGSLKPLASRSQCMMRVENLRFELDFTVDFIGKFGLIWTKLDVGVGHDCRSYCYGVDMGDLAGDAIGMDGDDE